MTPIPIIRLEVESMKFVMLQAISQYQTELDSQLRDTISRVCAPENIQRVLDKELSQVFEAQVAQEMTDFFRNGVGNDIVKKAVVRKLQKELRSK